MGEGDEIDIICFNVRCFSFKMHIAFSIAYITHLLVVYVKFLKFFFLLILKFQLMKLIINRDIDDGLTNCRNYHLF